MVQGGRGVSPGLGVQQQGEKARSQSSAQYVTSYHVPKGLTIC